MLFPEMSYMMAESLATRPLTPTLGAEVLGVDLSQALPRRPSPP